MELDALSEDVLTDRLNDYAWFLPGDTENFVSTEEHPIPSYPVRQKQPNAFGLYDSNLEEWCNDFLRTYTTEEVAFLYKKRWSIELVFKN